MCSCLLHHGRCHVSVTSIVLFVNITELLTADSCGQSHSLKVLRKFLLYDTVSSSSCFPVPSCFLPCQTFPPTSQSSAKTGFCTRCRSVASLSSGQCPPMKVHHAVSYDGEPLHYGIDSNRSSLHLVVTLAKQLICVRCTY